MSDTSLNQAVQSLQAAYGHVGLPQEESAWSRLLSVVLGVSGDPPDAAVSEVMHSSPLVSPRECAKATAGQLAEVLKPVPRGAQRASVVRTVAAWWMSEFGDQPSPEWTAGLETYRLSLRAIRGLGPATVDEILLFAAELPVFPVDRSALRVAVRHGWLDLPADDQDAQSLFVRAARQSVPELQQLSVHLRKIGQAHCGREPHCDGCPLQPLLPAGGPLDPQSC